jgi:hypothetical protein
MCRVQLALMAQNYILFARQQLNIFRLYLPVLSFSTIIKYADKLIS